MGEISPQIKDSTSSLDTSAGQNKIVSKEETVKAKMPEVKEAKKSVDLLIVLGQGPVKPLLREEDLDPQMRERWESFKTDPLHSTEPDFRVVEGDVYLSQLDGLDQAQVNARLAEWQRLGRFGLNRWGRQNALSAGYALVSGYTDRVLLSGGKTMPAWAKERLPQERLDTWPSEAELMADIIKRKFGPMYQELYGKSIDSVIITEDQSTNTLTNFARSINSAEGQEILDGMIKAGVLAANFHVPRGEDIATLFAPGVSLEKGVPAQDLLSERVMETKNGEVYSKILDWMSDPQNPDLRARGSMEEVWSKGLNDPEFLAYWLGYVGMVKDPRVLQATVQGLNVDPLRRAQAVEVFKIAGLDYNGLIGLDLTQMPQAEFKAIADKLTILATAGYRKMPEVPKA